MSYMTCHSDCHPDLLRQMQRHIHSAMAITFPQTSDIFSLSFLHSVAVLIKLAFLSSSASPFLNDWTRGEDNREGGKERE
ncbi:hypothetical protein EXN66_Car009576 [Channa argus]|uniref:Uncharacterized protein n=1 Tax=Channa argus TaxID=215402 RepID=A0A6G1PUB6_CHAAH|nr:hypothetical protein EXN66_Car009576 [Channa argus]